MASDATSGSGSEPDPREERPDQSPLHDRGELAAPVPSGSAGDGDAESGARHRPGGHRGPALYPLARSGFIEYDRVVFFSDAVFAIAVTLLAVELPRASPTTPLPDQLRTASGSLIGFAISFAVIGLYWLGHHGIFRYITAFDRPLIGLNLLFLGTIAFFPYPTELLSVATGPHIGAVVFYAAWGAAAGLAEAAIWFYATRAGSGLCDSSVSRVRLQTTLRILRVPAVFLISIPVAVVAPEIAPYIWILIWISGIAINRLVPRHPAPEQADS